MSINERRLIQLRKVCETTVQIMLKSMEMPITTTPEAITVSEHLQRRQAFEDAIANHRLEGLAPSAEARLLFEQFVEGELTEEQLMNAVLGR